jgi:iron complex outermembrane recepter protein
VLISGPQVRLCSTTCGPLLKGGPLLKSGSLLKEGSLMKASLRAVAVLAVFLGVSPVLPEAVFEASSGRSELFAQQRYTALLVRVVDSRTAAPIAGAAVSADGGAPAFTDENGRAHVTVRAAGVLEVTRIGYRNYRGSPTAADGAAMIALEPSPVALGTVHVQSRALGTGEAIQSAAVIGSAQLAERMAASVAAVIALEPGVTSRSNGPMATQPVIRGLSGDRVLVLEDGLRTGDISTTAPDHAVTIEPATARQIEVIRGPAGLLYGSNTLGGVVNVVRDDVPRRRPDGIDWSLSGYSETVNYGVGSAARVLAGAGSFVVQADGSARTGGDTRTPRGVVLPFTDLDGFDAGVGVSHVSGRGHIGAAVREYRTYYGVPSSFEGATLPGSHDGGVYVDVRRTSARFDAEWRPDDGWIEAVSAGGNAVRYEHFEFEQGGFIGTRFGQLARSGEAVIRMRSGRHRAALGTVVQWRDLRAAGSYTGTRPAVQNTTALFLVDEITVGSVTLLAGARADRISLTPLDSTETLLLRNIRSRAFTALTGAVGARAPLGRDWSLGVQLARAFRPPSIEELYSAGPHLASYAYEIGRPDLHAEHGLGLDAVLRWQGQRTRLELTGYAMRVADFITFAPQIDSATGLPMRDPRLRRYVVYRPQQGDARLAGIEGRASFFPAPGWLIDVVGDLPRGSTAAGEPLPSMPGGSARLEVRRIAGSWSAALHADRRFAQRRVPAAPPAAEATCDVAIVDGEARALPAEFCPAPATLLFGGSAALRLPASSRLPWNTAITLSTENAFDTRWRDPLWRAGLVAPQPGRNIRLAVQVTP